MIDFLSSPAVEIGAPLGFIVGILLLIVIRVIRIWRAVRRQNRK